MTKCEECGAEGAIRRFFMPTTTCDTCHVTSATEEALIVNVRTLKAEVARLTERVKELEDKA